MQKSHSESLRERNKEMEGQGSQKGEGREEIGKGARRVFKTLEGKEYSFLILIINSFEIHFPFAKFP